MKTQVKKSIIKSVSTEQPKRTEGSTTVQSTKLSLLIDHLHRNYNGQTILRMARIDGWWTAEV